MKKINIVKKNEEFNNIMKNGKLYKNRYYAIYIIRKKQGNVKFGIAVSKKIGNAVIRNKIKRQIRNIIDKSNIKFNSYDCIVVARKEILNINFQDRQKQLLKLLITLNEENKNE